MSKNFKFTVKEVNEFKYVKNGILYTVEAVNFSNFAGNPSFNAEIDGEIRSITYMPLDTGAGAGVWLYDNKLDKRAYCRFPYEVKSFEHAYKIIEV